METTAGLTRADFPVLDRIAYLNAGSVGPLSRRTQLAMTETLATDLQLGRGRASRFGAIFPLFDEARMRVGALIGVEPGHVLLATSTTEGCNIVLAGFPLEPGDEIVTTDSEQAAMTWLRHPAPAYAAKRVASIIGADVCSERRPPKPAPSRPTRRLPAELSPTKPRLRTTCMRVIND